MSIMRYLIQRELGQDVPTWVRARRAEGKTWPQVADEMSAALRLPPDQVAQISRQWLQKWVSRETSAPADEDDE